MPLNTTMIIKYAKLNNPKNHAFVIYKNEYGNIKIMKQFRHLGNLFSINEQCATYRPNQLKLFFNTNTFPDDLYIWVKKKIH